MQHPVKLVVVDSIAALVRQCWLCCYTTSPTDVKYAIACMQVRVKFDRNQLAGAPSLDPILWLTSRKLNRLWTAQCW